MLGGEEVCLVGSVVDRVLTWGLLFLQLVRGRGRGRGRDTVEAIWREALLERFLYYFFL